MPPETDCIVVGAGLVGSIAALGLAQEGRQVAVLESRPGAAAAGEDVRGLVLSAPSVDVLRTLNLWSALAPLAQPVTAIRISQRGVFGATWLRAEESGLPALGWCCPADRLQQALHQALESTAEVAVHWGTEFVDYAPASDSVSVVFRSASGTGRLASRLLIGADGSASAVRAAAAIEVERFDYQQQAIVASVAAESPQPGVAYEHFTAEGPLALLPQEGGRYVSVQCLSDARAAQALALGDDAYETLLLRRFGTRLGRLHGLGRRRAHRLVRVRAKRVHAPRLVLLGNAAHTVHPNAAQGLNLGLRDAAHLRSLLADQQDPGSSALLQSYAQSRRQDQRFVSSFTDLLAQGFRSPLTPARVARTLALRAVGHSGALRKRLVSSLNGTHSSRAHGGAG